MRIFSFLKHETGPVVLIVVLLLVQAFSELSIPRITADIVDVGIQQHGIDSVVPDRMTEATFNDILDELPSDEQVLLRDSYSADSSSSVALTEFGAQHDSQLVSILEMPLALRAGFSPGTSGSDEGLLHQAALASVAQEYRALGLNLFDVQMRYLLLSGLRMISLTALMVACAVAIGFLASRVSARVGQRLRTRLFSRVMGFSEEELASFGIASLITRATNDIQQIQSALAMGLRIVVYSPLLAVGGIIMVAGTCVSMVWTIVLAVIAILLVVFVLMKSTMPKFQLMQRLIDRLNAVSREALVGMSVIRAFCRQDVQAERFNQASTDLMAAQLFTGRAMSSMMPAMTLVMNAVSVLIVWVGASYVDVGAIQVGDLIAFITYSMVVIMSFLMIGMVAVMLPRANVAARRVDEVLSTVSRVEDSGDESIRTDGAGASVAFQGVTFAYEGSSEPVLSRVDFSVPAGSTTAIIGATGSGKSTVLRLIERFIDVDEGSVMVDGVDVRRLRLADLRRSISYVPQKAFLFEDSISGAIAFAQQDLSFEQIEQAARSAQADEFIDELPDGYETVISEGGASVSGGQRQRLAIARALARDARIYLFDDSFSALDYKTDAQLRHALRRLLADKTLIVVAQRVATIADADQIVVLDEGRVVGIGTHRSLLEKCPTYRQIALSQLSEEELGISPSEDASSTMEEAGHVHA